MNTEAIVDWLDAIGISHDVVSIGSEADNTWCLMPSVPESHPESDNEATWEVFWREQGNRYDWARFSNEQVACYYLFGRLAWSQVVKGKVGVLPIGADG